MASDQNNKKENKQSVWTKETLGVILILFCTLCAVCLITRETVFSDPGKWINSFLFGCFGVCAYLVIAYLFFVGVTMVFGKKNKMALKKKTLLTVSFLLVSVLAQVISMNGLTEVGQTIDYGGYLSFAYSMGEGGISTSSFSGLFASILSYPIASLLTNVGSYVVLGVLLATSLYFTANEFLASSSKGTGDKKKKIKEIFRGSFVKKEKAPDTQKVGGEQSVSAPVVENRARLFVNNPNDFAVRSKREIEKGKNAYDVLMNYSDNGLGVAYTPLEQKDAPSYSDDYKDKIDYIMTPTAINVEQIKSQTYDNYNKPETSNVDFGSTTVSDYVGNREEQEPIVNVIPHTEHEETSSFEEDSAENNAERFSRYADVVDFGGGRISTAEQSETFRSFVEEKNEDSIKEEPSLSVEEEIVEQHNKEEIPIVETFEEKAEEILPRESILGSRRVRNIFSEEAFDNEEDTEGKKEETFESEDNAPTIEEFIPSAEEEKVEKEETIERVLEEKEETPPAFTSRVSADNNFDSVGRGLGTRRTIFETAPEIKTQEVEQEKPKKEPIPINRKYHKPPLDLLETRIANTNMQAEDHEERKRIIQETLEQFHINAVPQNHVQGPSITRYEIMMPAGISVKKVLNYDDDLKMRLAVREGVRIEAPIPGKNLVGIEVANTVKTMVGLKEVMEGLQGKQMKESALMFALGKDIVGNSISDDLTKGPHYLIAGATGSGKSVALHVMIISLLMRYSPEELKLVLVDPKSVEFRKYDHIPHLLVDEIITEPKRALTLLQWAYDETNRRNEMFTECGGMISNIEDYNTHIAGPTVAKLPRIVFVIDELADLMEACKKDLEEKIRKIAAKSRSAGIHLVLATQRPSVDVITGTIKANLPSRIALKVMNYPDSQTILGEGGAEKLLGNGDMLYKNSSMADYERYQGAYISGREISNIVEYIKENNKAYFDDEVQEFLDKETRSKPEETSQVEDGDDSKNEVSDLFLRALWLAINMQSASIAQFQRRFSIGYSRAGGLIDKMERMGLVSGNEGAKARRVLITKEEFENRFGAPPPPED